MIQFIKDQNFINGANELANLLNSKLSHGPVLWIVSGGSNILIEKYILDQIENKNLANLEVILGDERFVSSKDPNSNYLQLISIGFKNKRLNFEPILRNQNLEDTKKYYLNQLLNKLNKNPVIIGQFGIGADGHTLGILPFSTAISSKDKVLYIEGKDFMRLSLSLDFIKKSINYGYLFCFGKDKQKILQILKSGNGSQLKYPSLIFRQIKSIKLYNEYIGG